MPDNRSFLTDCWIHEHCRSLLALRSMMHSKSNPGLLPRVHMAMATFVPKQDRIDLHIGETVKALGQVDVSRPEPPMQPQKL